MSGVLLVQTWRWQAIKLAIVTLALAGWGVLFAFLYVTFSDAFRDLIDSGVIPRQFTEFGNGDLFSLPGAVALGMVHPIFLALVGIFAVGLSATAVAGERQRGTLEVLLARPVSRRGVYVTLAAAIAVLIAIPIAAAVIGLIVGASLNGVADELDMARLPLVWLNAFLLWAAFASFGLAASVTFSRSGPALGLTLGYLLVMYFIEILGSLWEDAKPYQDYSIFHHFQPKEILTGGADWLDFALLAALVVLPALYALVVFPRRDIPAPS
ncbi:MAG: ABC transporter permease [Chloroflexota bacterium]|nr:ABC transporter permease [Chloroflexota bacterium]